MREVNLVYGKTPDRKDWKQAYNKKYRLTHNEHVICACGNVYREISKYAHIRSKRHELFIANMYNGSIIDDSGADNNDGDGDSNCLATGKISFRKEVGVFLLWD